MPDFSAAHAISSVLIYEKAFAKLSIQARSSDLSDLIYIIIGANSSLRYQVCLRRSRLTVGKLAGIRTNQLNQRGNNEKSLNVNAISTFLLYLLSPTEDA